MGFKHSVAADPRCIPGRVAARKIAAKRFPSRRAPQRAPARFWVALAEIIVRQMATDEANNLLGRLRAPA